MKQKNVIITGSGRSGTSMVAGMLAQAGYFMGPDLYPPRESNPKGFFESYAINGINEDILSRITPARPRILGKWFFRRRPTHNQRWLARVPLDTTLPNPIEWADLIQKLVSQQPFCFKDPRFSYTLPIWRPLLEDTVFVCVFRHPADTALSILKEVQTQPYLSSLSISFQQALDTWYLIYAHITEQHCHEGEWLFFHYDQAFAKEGLARLAYFAGTEIDEAFPEHRLRRSRSNRQTPGHIMELYGHLCELADY